MDKAAPRVKAACRLPSDKPIDPAMKQRPTKSSPGANGDRDNRLAEALRANLHRRKAQARAATKPADSNEETDQ